MTPEEQKILEALVDQLTAIRWHLMIIQVCVIVATTLYVLRGLPK